MRTVAVAMLAVLAVAAPAGAAHFDRLEVAAAPELGIGKTFVNILAPDASPTGKAMPIVYLLHGMGESHEHWGWTNYGDIERLAEGLDAVVAMPDGGTGFHTDHLKTSDPAAVPPQWTRHFLERVMPTVESAYNVRRGRPHRTIGGVSMGGYGAMLIAAQRPDLFGTAVALSGPLQIQDPAFYTLITSFGQNAEDMWGPYDGAYATAHNPRELVANLRNTRLWASNGTGQPDPEREPAAGDDPVLLSLGPALEAGVAPMNEAFAAAAHKAGVAVERRVSQGTHEWFYFRRMFGWALEWGLSGPVADAPETWTFRTARPVGRMWHLPYRFVPARPPDTVADFSFDRGELSATGSGLVHVCGQLVTLPFAGVRCPLR